MKLKNILCFLFFVLVTGLQAQSLEVNGTVVSSKNKQPVPGANVVIKNSKRGVITDMDGKYRIKVNPNEILVFTCLGYESKEVKVENKETLNVTLNEETNKLEEVVINVGYGTQSKKTLTNAISTIKADAFDDRPLYNVGQALQGNAAGVNVVQPSGKPGVALDIRVRGSNSIMSGVNPLYVIDGVQTYSSEGISTDDIADIQILKDATATAIYGVNGSSGVILITTKKGKPNKKAFTFSSYIGTSNIVKNINVLNLEQYKALMQDFGAIGTSYLEDANNARYAGINTNWSDKVFQTGEDKNYDFSFAGGSDKIRAFASVGYQDTKGIVKPALFNRLSTRLNLDIDGTSWLKAHANINLISTNMSNTNDNNVANQGGVILSALTTPAFLPIYADELVGGAVANGQLPGQFASNPVASLENPVSFQSRQEDTKTTRYLGNLGLDINLVKNLVMKPTTTVDMSRSVYDFFVDSYRSNYGRNGDSTDLTTRGIGKEHRTNYYTWNVENTLNYTLKTDNHNLTLLAGGSVQKSRFDQDIIEGTGFAPELRKLDLNQMMKIDVFNTQVIARESNSVSYFGRATYNYKGKYIVNGVFRASGVSKLAPGHKWGSFPGVSVAWVASNESFLNKSKTLSELKFRGGWGQTGNVSGLSEYASFAIIPFGSLNQNPANAVNIDLTWETTTDLNVGVDLGLFNNRVRLNLDAYKRVTNNLLNNIYISAISANYLYNAAKIENKGFEFTLNTTNFKGDFNWNTNINLSFIKNKVLEMGMQPFETHGYQDVNRIEKGQPLGNFFGYVVDRVNPDTGVLEYKDLDGSGTFNTGDRTIIGNALPDYTFGVTNTLSYKGISLDILFTGSQGNDIFNASRVDLEGMQNSKNQSVAVLGRWQQAGDITNIPKANDATSILPSNRFVEDGSYVRLKALTLGYNFKKAFLGLNSFRVYTTWQNLITWTKYSGFDPEVSSASGNTGVGQGIDNGTYPQVRTFIFGLKAGF